MPQAPSKPAQMSMAARIGWAMLAGAMLGTVLEWADNAQINAFVVDGLFALIGQIFANLLKMLVVPVVIFSLIFGVAGVGETRKLGRISLLTVAAFLISTSSAITPGLTIATLIDPGHGFELPAEGAMEARETPALIDVLSNIVPGNPIDAFASGNMLQIIFYVLLVASVALSMGERAKGFFDAAEFMNELMMMVALYVLGCLSPRISLGKVRSALMFAFSTQSSNATIPVTLQCMMQRVAVKRQLRRLLYRLVPPSTWTGPPFTKALPLYLWPISMELT